MPREVRVLLGDAVLRVEHEHDDVRVVDRLHRLDDRELLGRLDHLALPAHAGRVDDRVALAVALEVERDRVARRARLVERDNALLAEQRVDERGLADVRAADDRDAHAPLGFGLRHRFAHRHVLERDVDEVAHAFAVRGGHRQRLADAKLVELGDRRRRQAFALVAHEDDRASGAAQEVGDALVLRHEALARIDEERDDVALGDRVLGLPRHLLEDPVLGDRLEAAGVDDEELAVAEARAADVAVARQAGQVVHQRVARAREPVEQRRLADVGPADQGERGEHGARVPGVHAAGRHRAAGRAGGRPRRRSFGRWR